MKQPENFLQLLDELRTIAQLGLRYSKDKYDKERYERLLELASIEYSNLCGLPKDIIIERFKKELGHITPKVGVEAAIFSENGKIFLVKRSDDKLWSLPCGWAENCESPQDAIEREVKEETGLIVKVKDLIDVCSLMPGLYDQPHTIYHITYYCERIDGNLAFSEEVLESGYFNYKEIKEWHHDHRDLAEKAYHFHSKKKDESSCRKYSG